MADAYGNFSVATSSNCVVDSAALVSALNNFRWSDDGGNWATSKNGSTDSFWYNGGFGRAQYPTVRPKRTLAPDLRSVEGRYPVYGANGVKARSNSFFHAKASIIIGRKGSAGEVIC